MRNHQKEGESMEQNQSTAPTPEKKQRKFGIRDCLAYAAGDLGCNMSFALKGTVQTFWLVYMMMETGLLSLLLLLVQIWDAVNDPMIGTLIDNDHRNYKHGKYKQYIFIGACGLLIGGAAVFMPFPNASVVVKAVLFILGYVIWDAFYTIANGNRGRGRACSVVHLALHRLHDRQHPSHGDPAHADLAESHL